MNLFDILGPVMAGPSSSHTAGAVRIGLMCRKLLQDEPVYADIGLYGSFADTGRGHGTDKALCAGLLGMQIDDSRISQSLEIASHSNLKIYFSRIEDLNDAHPNTAVLTLQGKEGNKIVVQASSIGGGRIMINKIDGIDVNFSGEMHTLIVHNFDSPGRVSSVASLLSRTEINVATMHLYRNGRGRYAVMVIETDQSIPEAVIKELQSYEGIMKVTYIDGE